MLVEQTPQYRLMQPFYVKDTYIPEGAVIDWDGVPNEFMEAMNPAAEEKLKEYLQGLDDGQRAAGRISRKLEDIVMQEVANRPREPKSNTETVILPKYNPDVPAMGNIHKNGNPKKMDLGSLKIHPAEGPGNPKPISISDIKDLNDV